MPSLLIRIAAAAVVALAAIPTAAEAQQVTLRGLLQRTGPYGAYPATGIPVTVNSAVLGRSGAVYSGNDGMYYLYVPPGQYALEVWNIPGGAPIVFSIGVPAVPYFDIAPVQVP